MFETSHDMICRVGEIGVRKIWSFPMSPRVRASASSVGFCAAVLLAVAVMGSLHLAADGRQTPPASTQAQPTDPNLCLDEEGRNYSVGSIRKVNGQIQSCASGARWVAAPGGKVGTPTAEVGKKDCKGSRAQVYESGLFRPVGEKGEKFERCSDGKWSPSTGGGLTAK